VERVVQAVALLKEAGFFWDAEPKVVNPEAGRPTIMGVLSNGDEVPAPTGFRLPSGELCPELQLLSVSPDYDPLAAALARLVATRFRYMCPVDSIPNPLYDQEAEAFIWSQSPEEARKHEKILEKELPYVFLAMPLVKEAVRTD